jgi:carotenoid cleavage dioxygenase
MPYRVGFLGCPDPNPSDPTKRPAACYARFDHETRKSTLFNAGDGTTLAECCFAPRNKSAPEGDGYLMGVATRQNEGGRSDLIILDAQRLDAGPVATVKMPIAIVGQIHGWWVPQEQLPQPA